LLDLTPKFTVISSTVSNNLHVQVSRLTQQFCATEDAVSAFDGRLSRVERMPAMFEEMLDGVVEKLRIADNSGVLAELREALGCIKAAVMDLRDEVDGVKDMREAIRQLQGEVEELKQGRQRYGKERERAENGLEERWARDREVERARDERRAAKRAEEQCENDELRARVIAIGKQHSIMAQAFEALKADYEEKHCELVRKISARPAFDVQKSLQPLFGKLDRLHELLDATRQAGPTVVQDSRPHASPTLSTVDPMRFLDISLSDNGDEIPDMPLFNRADAAEVFTVVGGPVDPDPRDSIQFIDDGDYAHHTGRLTDSQAVHRYTQQPQPRSSSEDWVEEDPSLEQQVLYAETANMESGNITVGGAQ
jgi:TolA-binding protein